MFKYTKKKNTLHQFPATNVIFGFGLSTKSIIKYLEAHLIRLISLFLKITSLLVFKLKTNDSLCVPIAITYRDCCIIGFLILHTLDTLLCLLENSQLIKSYSKTKWYIVIILNLTGLIVQFYIMIAPSRRRRSSSCIYYYAVHTQ